MQVSAYACTVCGRPAPAVDSTEILEWQGGELAIAGETDAVALNLICPACLQETRPDDAELRAGDRNEEGPASAGPSASANVRS
jgi:hypothetical protein